MFKKFFALTLSFFVFLSFSNPVLAHEAYVVTQKEFQNGLTVVSAHPFAALLNSSNVNQFLKIVFVVVFLYFLAEIWSTTKTALILDKFIKRARYFGPLIIRAAISASFFYAAFSNAILGPELSLVSVPGGVVIRFLLLVLSLMFFFGFLTELSALIGLIIFFYITTIFKTYMITYANYFGELIVLFIFGSRFFSIDSYLFGKRTYFQFFEKFRNLEVPIVRILYGIALMYAGYSIKFSHQILSIEVYNQYHLVNFFHAPAEFIAAGAGLAEIVIGFFIFVGLEQRLTVLISLVFITLSILYFREMIWPHFMLYGISLSLIINSSDRLSLDSRLVPFTRNTLKKWEKVIKKR